LKNYGLVDKENDGLESSGDGKDFVFETLSDVLKEDINDTNVDVIGATQDSSIKPPEKLTKAEIDALAHQKLQEYQIIRILGQGAYAQVKLAQHKTSKKRVALKIYPKYKLNDPQKRKTV
jgi:serine/threonine protein kinase